MLLAIALNVIKSYEDVRISEENAARRTRRGERPHHRWGYCNSLLPLPVDGYKEERLKPQRATCE